LPDHTKLSWEKLHLAEGHDRPENTPDFLRKNWLDLGNQALARDLIDAIDHDREPLSSLGQVRSINEMVQGVYASHLIGRQTRRATYSLPEPPARGLSCGLPTANQLGRHGAR